MSKAYCNQCKWFYTSMAYPHTFCGHKSNVEDTPIGKGWARTLTPQEKNADNYCPYFEKEKPWWRRVFYIPGDKERMAQ